jgi:DNA-directed RNA polymerase specialized sigma24 family protein
VITSEIALADELRNIERFATCDREVADEAFTRLSDRVERFLWRYLAALVPSQQEREDVILAVLEKLYLRRSEFQLKGVGAWWSYVAITARRCVYDRSPQTNNVELTDEIPDRDLEVIGNFAQLSHFRSQLYRAADELWLGLPRDLAESERRRRLLAAQLFYLQDYSWQEIAGILGGTDVITRKTLDEWFLDRTVILDLAFNALYIDNDALICTMLRPERPLTRRELDEIVSESETLSSSPPNGWTWDETKIAVWRYRNGLLSEKIQQIGRHTPEVIEKALAKCHARLPFERRARDLHGVLAKSRVPADLLATPGLWKRLVFQYSIAHELPQRQILERIGDAARVAGFQLTEGMLSAWLSNGRLLEQLSSHVQEPKK